MDDRLTNLEERLDGAGGLWAEGNVGEAPRFLKAVRRRRWVRRARTASVVGAVLVVAGAVWLAVTPVERRGTGPIAGDQARSALPVGESADPASPTLAVLSNSNREMTANPVLPDSGGAHERPFRLLDSRNPAAFKDVLGV